MTAAEANVVVQEKEGEKKDVQNTEASENQKSVTGAEAGDNHEISDNKSKKQAKDSDPAEKDGKEPTAESPATDDAKDCATTTPRTDKSPVDETAPEKKTEDKTETSSESKTETKESTDPAVEAKLCLIQGKRNMLVQDYAMAVESLQRACELLAAKFGDDASQCAEALHYYGKALLELHRKESDALNDMGNQEATEDDSSDENEGEEEEEKETEDKKEEKERDGSSGEGKTNNDDAAGQVIKEEGQEEEDLEESDPNTADKEVQEAPDDDEDISNLQIAFEVLELAKKIYKRDAEKDPQLYLKAADCLLSLGEINLESDTYDRAIDDFEGCLRIQQEMLPRDARALAETNYQLGLTYSFVNKYEQSAAYFGDALQILELKVSNLKKSIDDEKTKGKLSSCEEDVIKRAEQEIDEIQQLLPEIVAKMEDAKEMQKDNVQSDKEKIIGEMMNRLPEASPVKKETKVNVISSSLIKKKRPADEAIDATASFSGDQAEKKFKTN